MGLREKLRAIWAELSRSDNYMADWYAAATNQISHTFLGVMFAVLFAIFTRLAFGEMLVREHILTVTACGFLAFQLAAQGNRGTDTLWDVAFFSMGGIMIIAPFREVSISAETTRLDFHHWDFLTAFAVWVALFIPYVLRRVK